MAHRTLWLSGLTLLAVAACSEPEGTGFTGISAEPQSVTSATFAEPAWPVAASQAGPQGYLKQDLPQISAHSRSTNTHVQAEEAVLVARKKNRVSTPVRLNGQDLRLTVVWVNQRPFAVLRPKSGSTGMRADGSTAFHSSVARLTGCPPASGVYVQDTNRGKDGITGMSVALGCIVAQSPA